MKTLAALLLSLAFALPAFAATPVDINHADAATIAKSLDGIGLNKAQAIVAWREAHGPFKSADQLAQIKGIGPRTLERNRDAIRLNGVNAAAKPAATRTPAKATRAAASR